MKKYKALRFILALVIVLTSTIVFPQAARAATPQVQTVTPANGTVISDRWNGVVTITYNINVAFGDSGQINLYRRYNDNGTTKDDLLDGFMAKDAAGDPNISIAGNTLTIDFYNVIPQAPIGHDFDGDINNTYGEDYKYRYWVEIDPGAIVSAGNDDPAEYFSDADYMISVQATPPQVVSLSPARGATNVNGDNLVLTMTFDEDVWNYDSLTNAVKIFKYDPGVGAWMDAPQINCTTEFSADHTEVYMYPSTDLEPDTLYGVMVSGIDNTIGPTDKFLRDYLWAAYGGIDYPSAYMSDFRFGDVWYFETAESFGPVTLTLKTPAAGTTEVPLDSDLTMVFSEVMKANDDGGDYNMHIFDYNTGFPVTSIDVDDILAPGEGRMTVTVSNDLFTLHKNKKYYVTIDPNAFVTVAGSEPFSGFSNKSWYFSTVTTHTVRFFDYDSSQIGTDQTVDYGDDTVPPADPARDGYVFKGWDGDYTNVTEDLDLHAVYAQLFTLDYAPGDNGSITGTLHQTVESGNDGTQVTADPDDHYHFVQWSDGVGTAARQDTNVAGDIDVTAQFAIDQFTLTYTAGAGGSIQGDTPQTVDYDGDGTQVTAVHDAGYHFVQWSDGVATEARTDTGITGDLDVTAQFAINQYTLTYTAGANGSIQGDSPQTVNHGSNGTQVTADPDDHYHFVQWSDGVMTAERTDTGVTDDIDVTAQFAIDQYTLTYDTDGHGHIDGDTPQTVDYDGNGTQVTAVHDAGYHFVQWSDGVATAARTDTGITGDLDVTAQFAINQYTLTYTAGANGSIQGASPQTVDYGDDGAAVTAVPDTGYRFVRWSDGETSATRTDTSVTGDIDVTADFELNVHTVTFMDFDGTVLKKQRVKHGGSASPPADPSRTGYAFTGWDKGYRNITSDLRIRAQYEAVQYTVTFRDYDGAVISTQYMPYGGAAIAPAAPWRARYIFTGWSTSFHNITGNLTVTAQYAPQTFIVTFADYDGTVLKTQSVSYGQGAAAPDVGEREGHIFVGWDASFDTVTTDMTVYAMYESAGETSEEPTPAPQDTPPPMEVSDSQKGDDGTIRITVDTGGVTVKSASVTGGDVTVNEDGSLTITLDDTTAPGEVEITLTFSDGTTATQTITIPEEQNPEAPAAQTGAEEDSSFPWVWLIFIIIVTICVIILTVYLRRKKRQ